MSAERQAWARLNAFHPISMTPWCRAAAGNTSDLGRLPDGYQIIGAARSPGGPYTLRLINRGQLVAVHDIGLARDVTTVVAVCIDLAWKDHGIKTPEGI